MAELISVIVATYNREDALGAVLRLLSRQTEPRYAVVVADDGSGPEGDRLRALHGLSALDADKYPRNGRGFLWVGANPTDLGNDIA
jgi:hypothetical protein